MIDFWRGNIFRRTFDRGQRFCSLYATDTMKEIGVVLVMTVVLCLLSSWPLLSSWVVISNWLHGERFQVFHLPVTCRAVVNDIFRASIADHFSRNNLLCHVFFQKEV